MSASGRHNETVRARTICRQDAGSTFKMRRTTPLPRPLPAGASRGEGVFATLRPGVLALNPAASQRTARSSLLFPEELGAVGHVQHRQIVAFVRGARLGCAELLRKLGNRADRKSVV